MSETGDSAGELVDHFFRHEGAKVAKNLALTVLQREQRWNEKQDTIAANTHGGSPRASCLSKRPRMAH